MTLATATVLPASFGTQMIQTVRVVPEERSVKVELHNAPSVLQIPTALETRPPVRTVQLTAHPRADQISGTS